MKKQTLATVVSADATGNEPSQLITTIALDRDMDEVVPEGCDYSDYQKNPVVMFGHQYDVLPVGATTALTIEPGRGIRARWRRLEGDEFASRVRNAYEQGVLRAASIGFLPIASEPNGRGLRFTRWTLTEWSLVGLPANAGAVRTLKRLKLWDEDAIVLELDDDPACSYTNPEDGTPCGRRGKGSCTECRRVYCAHHCAPGGVCYTCGMDDGDVLAGLSTSDIKAAFRSGISGALSGARRRSAVGDPAPDPLARGRVEVIDVDEHTLRQAFEQAIPGLMRSSVGAIVRRETSAPSTVRADASTNRRRRTSVFKDQFEYNAYIFAQSRAWEAAQAKNETQNLRLARERVIAAGLREALHKAPDLFPGIDADTLAVKVVDIIEQI